MSRCVTLLRTTITPLSTITPPVPFLATEYASPDDYCNLVSVLNVKTFEVINSASELFFTSWKTTVNDLNDPVRRQH